MRSTAGNRSAPTRAGWTTFSQWFAATQPASGFTKPRCRAYRAQLVESGLAPSTINLRLTAHPPARAPKRPTTACWRRRSPPGIARVKGARRQGVRIGNWLTVPASRSARERTEHRNAQRQARSRVAGVMLGCGLRREETAALTLEHIQQRDGRWVIVDLVGKGARVRSVPMPSWAKAAVDVWVPSRFHRGPCVPASEQGRTCVRRPNDSPSGVQYRQSLCGSIGHEEALRRTTSAAPTPSSPTKGTPRSSRSSCRSAMRPYRRPKGTWAWNKTLPMRLATTSDCGSELT